jgi:hypothetical protein
MRNFVREAVLRHWQTNLLPKTTANWVLTSNHSRDGRFHSSAALFKTKYSSFIAASSFRNCPLARTGFAVAYLTEAEWSSAQWSLLRAIREDDLGAISEVIARRSSLWRVLHRAVAEMPPPRGLSARSVRCQSRKLRAKCFEHFRGKVAPTIPIASEIAAALITADLRGASSTDHQCLDAFSISS